jgi:hypothetical protein
MLSVIEPSLIVLGVIMLSVVILGVVMLGVVVSLKGRTVSQQL